MEQEKKVRLQEMEQEKQQVFEKMLQVINQMHKFDVDYSLGDLTREFVRNTVEMFLHSPEKDVKAVAYGNPTIWCAVYQWCARCIVSHRRLHHIDLYK